MTHPNVTAAEDMQIHQEDAESLPEPVELSLWDTLERTRAASETAAHLLAKQWDMPDEIYQDTLSAKELKINRNGRHYFYVLSPVAVASCLLNAEGIQFTFNLAAGWNLINAPDGSLLSVPGTVSQLVMFKRTNWLEGSGGAVASATSGNVGAPVALASGTATQTNAGSETKISFASTANHWTMQNNSTANIYYTTDGTVASTSSLVLAPGAQVFYDWPLTTIHVYTAAAQNINGATGIVIQGRA